MRSTEKDFQYLCFIDQNLLLVYCSLNKLISHLIFFFGNTYLHLFECLPVQCSMYVFMFDELNKIKFSWNDIMESVLLISNFILFSAFSCEEIFFSYFICRIIYYSNTYSSSELETDTNFSFKSFLTHIFQWNFKFKFSIEKRKCYSLKIPMIGYSGKLFV